MSFAGESSVGSRVTILAQNFQALEEPRCRESEESKSRQSFLPLYLHWRSILSRIMRHSGSSSTTKTLIPSGNEPPPGIAICRSLLSLCEFYKTFRTFVNFIDFPCAYDVIFFIAVASEPSTVCLSADLALSVTAQRNLSPLRIGPHKSNYKN
jgi:hypothetical protein